MKLSGLIECFLPTPPILGNIVFWIPFIVFPLFVGLLLIFVWLSIRAREKRILAMQSVASELGLEFLPQQPDEFDSRIAKYKLMNYGSSRLSSNFVLAKTDELSLVIFDHQYTSYQGKSKKVHRQSVALVISSSLRTPQFILYPESWLDRIGDLFVKKDIDIVEDPIFSKTFVLLGDDANAVRQFFDTDRRDSLLKMMLPTVECFPGEFMFYRPNKRVSPSEIKDLMEEAFSIYQAFSSKKARIAVE